MRKKVAAALVISLAVAMTSTHTHTSTARANAAVPAVTSPIDVLRHSAVLAATERAAEYYRPTLARLRGHPTNTWSWATYANGILSLYQQVRDARYLSDGMAWGAANNWQIAPYPPEYPADSLKALQIYYDLHAINPSASFTAADVRMAADLAKPVSSQYTWIDALFMGMPDWVRWADRTGDPAYLDKVDEIFTWARDSGGSNSSCGSTTPQDGLFDASHGLWYRDCAYIGRPDPHGLPIFWGRGNGWVIAAMAQVLDALPGGDPRGAKYGEMLTTMAARLIQLQGSDGLWRSSLLDNALYPEPETSATALITYALAYGIKAGILDAATYLPPVVRAWKSLTTIALQPSGFVANCQPVGGAPARPYTAKAPRVAPTATSSGTVSADSPPYCVGGFLLAGVAVAQLISSPSDARPVTFTAQETGNEASRVNDGDLTTRWSAQGYPAAVTIDLGATLRLSNAMVVPFADRAYRYRIDTSTDNVHWLLAIDRTATTVGRTHFDDFLPALSMLARYARLTVTGIYGLPTPSASIQEFAVYAGAVEPTTARIGRSASAIKAGSAVQIGGRIVSTYDGRPIPGATVELLGHTSGHPDQLLQRVRANQAGLAQFTARPSKSMSFAVRVLATPSWAAAKSPPVLVVVR